MRWGKPSHHLNTKECPGSVHNLGKFFSHCPLLNNNGTVAWVNQWSLFHQLGLTLTNARGESVYTEESQGLVRWSTMRMRIQTPGATKKAGVVVYICKLSCAEAGGSLAFTGQPAQPNWWALPSVRDPDSKCKLGRVRLEERNKPPELCRGWERKLYLRLRLPGWLQVKGEWPH